MATTASIKLYINRNCPWAHRVHIALAELAPPKIAFFVETYFSKANIYYYRAIEAKTDGDAEDLGKRYFDAVVTDVEPLLRDAN